MHKIVMPDNQALNLHIKKLMRDQLYHNKAMRERERERERENKREDASGPNTDFPLLLQ